MSESRGNMNCIDVILSLILMSIVTAVLAVMWQKIEQLQLDVVHIQTLQKTCESQRVAH